MSLAIVKSPAVDSIKELEEGCVLPLMLGLQLGSCRQAAFFTKVDETLAKQLLAGVIRLSKPTGGRRVDQQRHKERLQLGHQLEQRQDHAAAARSAPTSPTKLRPRIG